MFKVFMVIWNTVLTIALIVIVVSGTLWNAGLTESVIEHRAVIIKLARWFEDDFEDAIKAIVDKRMVEYAEELAKLAELIP